MKITSEKKWFAAKLKHDAIELLYAMPATEQEVLNSAEQYVLNYQHVEVVILEARSIFNTEIETTVNQKEI